MYYSQLEAYKIRLRILENYVLIPLSPQAKMKTSPIGLVFFVPYGEPNLFEDTIGHKRRVAPTTSSSLGCTWMPVAEQGIRGWCP
jgi:hypothetical protein